MEVVSLAAGAAVMEGKSSILLPTPFTMVASSTRTLKIEASHAMNYTDTFYSGGGDGGGGDGGGDGGGGGGC